MMVYEDWKADLERQKQEDARRIAEQRAAEEQAWLDEQQRQRATPPQTLAALVPSQVAPVSQQQLMEADVNRINRENDPYVDRNARLSGLLEGSQTTGSWTQGESGRPLLTMEGKGGAGFQSLGKYATPQEFVNAAPDVFAKVNPDLAGQYKQQSPQEKFLADISRQAMQVLQDPSIPMAQKIQVYQAMNKGQDMDSVLKGLQIKKAERDLNAPIPGEKPPAGYRFTPSGDLVPITGGPADPRNQADKPLTEFQGKSAAFGTRAAVAHGILNSVGDGGKVQPGMIKRSLEAVPWAGEGLGTLSNWTQSPKQQQVDQAQRDFVNAVLRQESGAAIGPDEFANATKQYFPQPGDSPDVIRQKAENRETAIAGFELNAGNRGGAAVRAAGGSANTVTPPGSPAHKTDWLARAKAKNPGMSGAALEAEYLKKFRG
jgi:hypothetical protein